MSPLSKPWLFFQSAVPLLHPPPKCLSSACSRQPTQANINSTSDSKREDEIAAKIANLRKQKRLSSQRRSDAKSYPPVPGNDSERAPKFPSTSPDELPDWKREELLQEQICEAEAFFRPPSPSSPESNTSEGEYKPRVSTWGVFPRPDNISKSFGGGRNIQRGGVDLNSADSKERDLAVAKKLAAYRAARGIDTEREERHREEIEKALKDSEQQAARSQPYQAISTLEAVRDYVSDRSRLGGSLYLALALQYDSVGRRDEARAIYAELRRNPFPEISSKAKQLVQGFEAMDMLRVEDETRTRGFRVTKFQLPDMSSQIDRRYETAVGGKSIGTTGVGIGTNLLLFTLLFSPLAFVFLVQIMLRR
eukprot:GFKZ01007665.1.p1 GENE.GFKZ01007665.1~~GFKZ01007665.1.p1  ORF type:complete len:364 (+),score=49.42 GFKZ01007665.1:122-1213(+)